MLNIHFEYAALQHTLREILQNYDQLVFLVILVVLFAIFVIALDSFSLDHIRQLKKSMALSRNKKEEEEEQDLPKHQTDEVSLKRKRTTLDENHDSFIHRSNTLNIALQME